MRTTAVLLLAATLPLPLPAAELTEPREWKQGEQSALPYRWHAPATREAGRKYPLVLFLHGAGERGADNSVQLKHGVPEILEWSEQAGEPCFLIAPQCPTDCWWAEIDRETMRLRKDDRPSAVMEKVIALLEDTMRNEPVDPDRLYVTGLSMGGYGTWDLLGRLPGRIAAAIPICGGGLPESAAKFKDVPLWVFHGAEDPVVPPRTSREMVAALREAGGNPRLTEFPGVKHESWKPAYADDNVLRWLFDQRRPPAKPAGP